jgi:CheY-like chemotaxis protein
MRKSALLQPVPQLLPPSASSPQYHPERAQYPYIYGYPSAASRATNRHTGGSPGPPAWLNVTENEQERKPRLVLADDHLDVLEAIRYLLASDFDILRTAAEGHALVQAAAELSPDAVVSDIQMPGLDGIEAGGRIIRQGLCNAVVVLTMYNEPHLVRKALQAGIRGYVLKVDAGEELIPAVNAVLAGGSYLSRGVSERLKP